MILTKIKHQFNNERIQDEEIDGIIREEYSKAKPDVKNGAEIAIAVGSRGIYKIDQMVKTLVACVKESGGKPFIVPAMGSHGGATAEGQIEVLASYNITEESVGAPVKSSMEVVELPNGGLKNKVYMDKNAFEADGTIVINRVKVHTAFHGEIESGLLKMLVIGLGKHQGALQVHAMGPEGLKKVIPETGKQILKKGNIIFGLAIVENANEKTARIKGVSNEDFYDEEKKLLHWSRKNMPRLPVDQLDVLLIDEFGKDISGTGMDIHMIGRMHIKHQPEPKSPVITSIVVFDLTEASHGNANGMGLADVITRRLYDKIDFKSTYANVLTTGFLERGMMPVVAETEKEAIHFALKQCYLNDVAAARIIRIKNTLALDEIWVSPAVLDEIKDMDQIEVMDETSVLPI